MTTPNPTDSGQQAGAVPDANLSASPAGDQPNSQGTALTTEQYRQIAREEAQKAWQSGKDRRFESLEREQGSQRTLLEAIQAKIDANPGMTIAQANREVQIDQLLESKTVAPASQGSGTQGTANDVVQRLVKKFEMDVNDPEVGQLVRENVDVVDLSAALSGLQYTRKTSPNPNLATNASPVGGGSVNAKLSSADIEQKATELSDLLREPTRNAAKIKLLQNELGPDYA